MRVLRMTKAARINARIGVGTIVPIAAQGFTRHVRPITNPMIVVHLNVSASEDSSFMAASLRRKKKPAAAVRTGRTGRHDQRFNRWSDITR